MPAETSKSEYTLALELLTRSVASRDHSRFELRQKLTARFSPEAVEQAMDRAETAGCLLPDQEVAAHAIEVWERKQKSPAYIAQQLEKRGLPVPPARPEQEAETLRALIAKKFGEVSSTEERARAYRFLVSRGFEDHSIRMVIDVPE